MEIQISDQIIDEAIKKRLDLLVPSLLNKRLDTELQTKKIYNIKEACVLLDMSFNTIKKYLRNGDIEHSIIGNSVAFNDNNLVEFIRSGKWKKVSFESFQANKKKLFKTPSTGK